MSELTLRFGEARLHVEGDADLVARERAAFLEHLGRLDRQSEKAGELLAVLLRAGHAPEKAEEPVSKKAEPEEPAEEKSVTQDDLCRLRSIHVGFISPSQLKRAKAEGKLDHLLDKHDEIEVPLDTGGTVTVVCCYVTPTSARFVFKDCWDEGVMNDEATNKTGYFKSKGRKHVLEDIYPHIAAEWREIIVPRTFVETIEGERVEYSDPLWLPSATDVFGTPDGAWWKDGDDDFQLPVFARERDRVKECGDKGTYLWWLRSVRASSTANFCNVHTGGSAYYTHAYRNDLGYFQTRPNRPFMGHDVAQAPEYFTARVLKTSPMKALTGKGRLSKGFLVEFKSGHVGMVQRIVGTGRFHYTVRSGAPSTSDKMQTMGSPSAAAMHSTIWPEVEPEVELFLAAKLTERAEQVLARAKRKA